MSVKKMVQKIQNVLLMGNANAKMIMMEINAVHVQMSILRHHLSHKIYAQVSAFCSFLDGIVDNTSFLESMVLLLCSYLT